jgi:hypothetical protein
MIKHTDSDKAYEHYAGAKVTVTGHYETAALNGNMFKKNFLTVK